MNVYAIIVAGGTGSRMNNALPKQFLPINGKPILYYSIKAFIDALPQAKIIVVLHPDYFSAMNGILIQFEERPDIQIVSGGITRFESVKYGIDSIVDAQADDIVMVHDAARPLLSNELIHSLYSTAQEKGSAIPALPIPESVRQLSEDTSIPIDRETLRMIQTPQVAKYEWIKKAFQQEYTIGFTDEATVLQAANFPIHLITGDANNIKITTPDQMLFATFALSIIRK